MRRGDHHKVDIRICKQLGRRRVDRRLRVVQHRLRTTAFVADRDGADCELFDVADQGGVEDTPSQSIPDNPDTDRALFH